MTIRTVAITDARGVFELGNGHWLVAGSAGLQTIDANNNVTLLYAGTGYRYIEAAVLP
jgi:hypothetical protein